MYLVTATINNIMPIDTRACFFNSNMDKTSPAPIAKALEVNMAETAAGYLITVSASGYYREDFSVEIQEGVISITAEKETVGYGINDRWEYDIMDWTKKFTLPGDADALLAEAKCEKGELKIRIPRSTAIEKKATLNLYIH